MRLKHIYLHSLGFTLIEMLLVVILIGVVAGVSIPQLSRSYHEMKMTHTASHISYLARYAQSQAITKNQWLRLVVDTQERRYRLEQSADIFEENFYPLAGRWGRQFPLGPQVSVTGDKTACFYPDGMIEKKEVFVCADVSTSASDCVMISTKLQPGFVHLIEGVAP